MGDNLLERMAAAPPRRKRQLVTIMDRSLPWYQLLVTFSWLTMSTVELGRAFRRCLARSTQTRPEAQPIPEKL